jgi:glycosyltransferase involved in cell wall biosynthesis
MKKDYPNVLVFANNAFSTSDANGRTLGNFFLNWPKKCLAQFALRAKDIDTSRCDNYFIVSDRQVLNSFKTGKAAVNAYKGNNASFASSGETKIKRSPFTMLMRNLIWKSNRWRGKKFNQWIESFKPDMILLQAGDAPFMYDLALQIAKEKDIPLVVYNSECYYFKDFCYFRNTYSKWLYPLFRRVLKKSFEKFMEYTSGAVYITQALEDLHKASFRHKSITLMTSSALPKENNLHHLPVFPKIVYLGNLGLNRHKNLIFIAQTLQKINPAWKVEVYGKVPIQAEQELKNCSGIILKGFVSYEEVIKIQQEADLLLHTEYNDAFYMKDLKYAFSTKIADCLSSGVPFLVFAPEEFTFIEYLKSNKAAFVVTNKQDLTEILKEALLNEEKRNQQVKNALILAQKNHEATKNAIHFEEFLREIYENQK